MLAHSISGTRMSRICDLYNQYCRGHEEINIRAGSGAE